MYMYLEWHIIKSLAIYSTVPRSPHLRRPVTIRTVLGRYGQQLFILLIEAILTYILFDVHSMHTLIGGCQVFSF